MAPMLSVAEAHARVIAAFSPLPAETVSIADTRAENAVYRSTPA